MNFEERKRELERLVNNDVGRIVFDFGNNSSIFLTDARININYVSNTLIFVTMLLLKKFSDFKKELDTKESITRQKIVNKFSNSMVRLYNLLDGVYTSKQLNFELIDNLLVNLQMDATHKDGGENFISTLGLEKYFSFETMGNHLTKYIYEVKRSIMSSRNDPISNEELLDFFRMFPFLSFATLEFKDVETKSEYGLSVKTFSLKYNNDVVDFEDYMMVINGNDTFYLNSFVVDDPRAGKNKNLDQKVTATYLPISNGEELNVLFTDVDVNVSDVSESTIILHEDTAIEDFFIRHNVLGSVATKDGHYFFKDYIFFNNRYIRNLAIVYSDLLTPDGKKIISKELLEKKYKDIYEKLINTSDTNINLWRWDELLIFLLIEEGILDFTKFLFKMVHIEYAEIIEKFKMRFGNKVNKICDSNEFISNPLIYLRHRSAENKYTCYAEAIVLFATKLFTANNIDFPLASSTTSLGDVLGDINELLKSDSKVTNKIKVLCIASKIIHVNDFLYVFHRGLFEHIRVKKLDEISEESRMLDIEFSRLDTEENNKNALQEFTHELKDCKERVHATYHKFIERNRNADVWTKVDICIRESFKRIIELAEVIYKKNSDESTKFYEITGRDQFLDIAKTLDFEKNICELIKKAKAEVEIENTLVADVALYTTRYLEYLRGGENAFTLEDAIYPIVGSCNSNVLSQDGYRYSYITVNRNVNRDFRFGSNREDAKYRIKVITEENLEPGKTYYFMPNINRCAAMHSGKERVWIKPTIIPCNAYVPDAKFERLEDECDFEETAELLYYSDEKVYQNMFGSVDVAKKVFPRLFQMDSIFAKEHIYLLKTYSATESCEIIGVATFYDRLPDWNMSDIESALEDADEVVPDTISAAIESLEDTFSDTTGGNYIIGNICVKKNRRGMGYGTFMIRELFKIAELVGGRNVILAVYEDNTSALNLYNTMGFVPYGSDFDNRGQEGNKESYIKMVRYS